MTTNRKFKRKRSILLEGPVAQCDLPYLSNSVAHILVDCIGHLCSLYAAAKLHVQDSRVVSQPPVIGFVPCQPCAVDTGLLTSTDANNLSNKGKTHVTI